jgi:putative transposase
VRSRDRQTFDIHGNVHFVTSTVVGFLPIFQNPDLAVIFVDNLCFYQDRGDFTLLAWVLMPDHFHLVFRRSENKSVSQILGNLKRMTSRQITEQLEKSGASSLLSDLTNAALKESTKDSRVWQYRFDSLVITREETLRQKIDYIHFNPVRRGLVAEPEDWSYSSAVNYSGHDRGLVDADTAWKCLGYQEVPSGKGS